MNTQTLRETQETPITNKARESAHDVVDKVADSSAELERKARHGTQLTEQKVEELTQQALKSSGKYMDAATQYVRDNPVKSVGIAVASGYLLAKLVNKS